MTEPSNALRLRPGVTDPVILLISREAVDACDVDRVYRHSVRFLMAAREDAILYRQQLSVVFEGWENDPRELVDVPEVRAFVKALTARWPEWAFFFNQQDPSIGLWISCLVGESYPGGGAVEINVALLTQVLNQACYGMNSIYDAHGLSEEELATQSLGFIEVVQQMI